jgi:tetratricopeptide (TPR) repeat protein
MNSGASIRLAAAFVCCSVACGVAVSAQDIDDQVRNHFQAARQAQDSGDLGRAVTEYLAVLRLDPSLAEAHANLGLVYQSQSKFAESASAFEKALALKPGLRGACLFLGIDYVKLNAPQRAIARLKQAALQEPANKEALSWLSGALWSTGQSAAAIETLQKAERILPHDSDILFLLGEAFQKSASQELERVAQAGFGSAQYHQMFADIYAAQQGWEKAIRHYQRAIEKDARWPGAHLGLGEVYWRQGKLEEAQAEYHNELQVAPESIPAKVRLAEYAILAGDVEGGLRALAAAIHSAPRPAAFALGLPHVSYLDPEEPVSEAVHKAYAGVLSTLVSATPCPARTLALASAYARLGRPEKALQQFQEFERAAAQGASTPLGGYTAALGSFERRDYDAAAAQLRSWLTSHPTDLAARYLLGRTYHCLSLALLERMLAVDPDSYRAHQLLARTYDQREDNARALADYRIVAEKSPELPGIHFAIGQVLWRNGEADEAMDEFTRELHLNPGHAEASAELGTILVSQHEPLKAIPYLQAALRIKPELSTAHQQLGKAFYLNQEYTKAERELKATLSADNDGTVHYLLGMVYRELGRTEESRQALAESRRIKSERLAEQVGNTAESGQ